MYARGVFTDATVVFSFTMVAYTAAHTVHIYHGCASWIQHTQVRTLLPHIHPYISHTYHVHVYIIFVRVLVFWFFFFFPPFLFVGWSRKKILLCFGSTRFWIRYHRFITSKFFSQFPLPFFFFSFCSFVGRSRRQTLLWGACPEYSAAPATSSSEGLRRTQR